MALEEPANAWLAVDESDDRRHLAGNGSRPEELAEHAHPEAERVGSQGGEVLEQRLRVARVRGAVARVPLLLHAMGHLGRLDGRHQGVDRRDVTVERGDHAPEHGVHLGPVDAFQGLEVALHSTSEELAVQTMDGANLDVGPAVADPGAPVHPARCT
jgi:hypothetical protein